ncbi:MAG: zf-HC2 domain-containing protein [Xanthomonadaceae bacterium]|nr:zf-HC2 domain-containing protein [Xanthomonadaceae bacterium]
MNCEQVQFRIDEIVDGEMPPAAQAELRTHLVGCSACDAEVRAAFDLRARLAALPNRVAPARDLWPEIATRIATRNGVVRQSNRAPLAIAAAAAGIAIAALVALLVTDPTEPLPTRVAGDDAPASVVVAIDPGLRLAGQAMLDSAETGGGDLSPEAIAIVRENLELIDSALREIALALEMEPDNPQLQRQLLDTYRGQAGLIEFLGRVSAQPTMRTDL